VTGVLFLLLGMSRMSAILPQSHRGGNHLRVGLVLTVGVLVERCRLVAERAIGQVDGGDPAARA
jgi:hypothetical protein